MSKWSEYISKTKGKKPPPLLVRAVSFCHRKEFALDLGAGALNEAKYLASRGFHVVAIDSEKTPRVSHRNIEVHITPMEKCIYPSDTFDLVSAQFSLPFLKEKDVGSTVKGVYRSMRRGGVFVGQFLGPKDDWARNKDVTVLTRSTVKELLSPFKVISFDETNRQGITAEGSKKRWHVFSFIVRKPSGGRKSTHSSPPPARP